MFKSQITFLYFKDFSEAIPFFETTLNLELVADQGFARIYRLSDGAFVGIVDEAKGHCNAPTERNVLITLVTDDVHAWYRRLKDGGVAIEAPPAVQARANVECFFFQGPGGYAFEIQKFLNPKIAAHFMGEPSTRSCGRRPA